MSSIMFCQHPDLKTELKALGYWRRSQEEESDLPWPVNFIDPFFDEEIKQKVIQHIQNAPVFEHWMGYAECRICQEELFASCLYDGTYIFPKGFDHYLSAHNVCPPQEFIDFALARLEGSIK